MQYITFSELLTYSLVIISIIGLVFDIVHSHKKK